MWGEDRDVVKGTSRRGVDLLEDPLGDPLEDPLESCGESVNLGTRLVHKRTQRKVSPGNCEQCV